MKFNWPILILAIIVLTGFAAAVPQYGKWFLAIVLLGALSLATNRIVSEVK